jgi:hypothetical protein
LRRVSDMLEPLRVVRGPNKDRFVNGKVAGLIRVSVPFTIRSGMGITMRPSV